MEAVEALRVVVYTQIHEQYICISAEVPRVNPRFPSPFLRDLYELAIPRLNRLEITIRASCMSDRFSGLPARNTFLALIELTRFSVITSSKEK